MTESGIATAAPDKIVLAVVSYLNEVQIDDALALFADEFSFKDHGVGLEFNTKDRLAEFFKQARELYLDMFLQTERIFVSGSKRAYRMDAPATGGTPTFVSVRRGVGPHAFNSVSSIIKCK